MKTYLGLIVVTCLASACGIEEGGPKAAPSNERGDISVDVRASFERYVAAVVAEDEAALAKLLSEERLGRIAAKGSVAEFAKAEHRKLNLALKGAPSAGIGIAAVQGVGSPVVSVLPSLDGVSFGKPFVFVLAADGSYRYNGQLPRAGWVELDPALAADVASISSPLTTATYTIHNTDSNAVKFKCKEGSLGQWGSERDLSGDSYSDRVCTNACTGWFDSGHFDGNDGGLSSWEGLHECDWNNWGDDFFYDGGAWTCTDVCS